jgi:hypothetical protein
MPSFDAVTGQRRRCTLGKARQQIGITGARQLTGYDGATIIRLAFQGSER